MRPQSSELSQLPATSSILPLFSPNAHRQQAAAPCRPLSFPSTGHAFYARQPLLLTSQLPTRCYSALRALPHSRPCVFVRHSRGQLLRTRLLLAAEMECACRHSRGSRGAAASAAATQQGGSERGLFSEQQGMKRGRVRVANAQKPGGTSGPGGAASGADFLQAEGWQPGDGVRPTPQQELLLLKLIASPQHREVDKKKIVLMACVLGVDVVQTLERAGLGMDWLTDVGSPGEMLDDLISYENPLETYWENMSTLFEDGVKGRRKFLEQPAAAAKKGFGGGSSGGGGGSGKGRKSKPRKVKSSYMLAAELVAKERKKRLQQEAAEAAAENAVLDRLMDDWSPEEREAYTMASYHWDIAMAATLLGVYTFVQLTTYGPHADEHSTVSFTSAVELLMAVRAAVWRSIDMAHGRGNASGRPEVLYALQGMLAHKAFDALQKNIERLNTYAAQGEYSSGWVGQTEKQMLSILSEESPPSLPLPPAYAFVPPACGGLSIVEEILARQVAGSVEAWEKLGPHQRMERLVTPGWSTVAPLLIRSIRRIEREEDQTQAAHLLGIEYDPALDGEAQPFADSLEMQYRQPSGAPSDAEGPTSAEGSATEGGSTTADPTQQAPDQADTLDIEAVAVEDTPLSVAADVRAADVIPGSSSSPVAAQLERQAWPELDPWVAAAASVGAAPFSQPESALQQAEAIPLQSSPVPVEPLTVDETVSEEDAAPSVSVEAASAESALAAGQSSEPSTGEQVSSGADEETSGAAASAGEAVEADSACDAAVAPESAPAEAEVSEQPEEMREWSTGDSTDQAPRSVASRNGTASTAAESPHRSESGGSNRAGWSTSDGRGWEYSSKQSGENASGANSANLPYGSRQSGENDSSGADSRSQGKQGQLPPPRERGQRSHFEREHLDPQRSSASSATGDWARLNRPVLPPTQEQWQGQGRPQQSREGTPPNGQQAPKQAAKEAGPDRDLGIFTPGKRRSYADQLLTEGTYLAKQLLPHDQRHWKAAGILLFSHAPDGSLQLLLGRIDSGHHQPLTGRWRRQEGWWILGGKRDPTDFSAEATAVREMTEETAGILSGYHVCGDDLGEVLWYPPGHYAVFPYQLQGRADIPRRYARLRASRGRVKGRRRLALVRQAGHPKPMSSLAWIPLSELIAGRCRLHWILEDMLRRTPLLPYLLQMERLGASATPARLPPTSSPGPPYRQGQSPTISSPKGSSTRATNSRAEVQSAPSDIRVEVQSARSDWTYVDRSGWTYGQQNGAAKSGATTWEPVAAASRAPAAARSVARSAPPTVSASGSPVIVDAAASNGAAAVANGKVGGRGAEAAGLVRPRPAGPEPGTPRNGAAAPGEGRFAAIAQAAREFLDASGAAPEEEGTQRETAAAGGPLHSNSKPLLRPRKRRRPRLKRVQMKRGA